MKKALNLSTTFSLLAVLAVLTFSTCKKDTTSASRPLIGNWSKKLYADSAVMEQYEFKSNDSVVYYIYKIDAVSKSVIGYKYKYAGLYKIDNSIVTLYNMIYFYNPTEKYAAISQMAGGDSYPSSTYKFELNSQKNTLTLYITPCSLALDCFPAPIIYHRE